MMRNDFELTATPTTQTPECSTPASPYADGSSDGEYFSSLTAPRHNEAGMQRHEFSLPPVDGGKDAWLFLAACFAVDALVWGRCFPPRVLPFRICFRYVRWSRNSSNEACHIDICRIKGFLSHSASSRITISRTNPSRRNQTLPSLVPLPWASCI
jgi:hypothetical protein